MAAGLGTRMRSATPKHLHPLLGRRMVDWVLETARATERGAARRRHVARSRMRSTTSTWSCKRAPRHRRRRGYGAVEARRFRRRRARARGCRAAGHGRAARAARRGPCWTAGGRDRPLLPRRRPALRSNRAHRDGSVRRSSRTPIVRRAGRSASSTPRSTSSTPQLWQALDRLDAHNAQGELYLTDCVRHIVEAGAERLRRSAPTSAPRSASTPAPSWRSPQPSSGTASTSSTCWQA